MTNYRIVPDGRTPYLMGRHVNHDPRSRAYAFRAAPAKYATVNHVRHVPIFDQGDLGSCPGEAAIGCVGTGAFYETAKGLLPPAFPLTQIGAVAAYSAATALDPFPGAYPPEDTGSDGNSVAMALKNAGMISGYTHAFSYADAMAALQQQPLIFGLNWYEGMFTPGQDGTLHVTGNLAGGHEVVLGGYDATTARVRVDNSWGAGWGQAGSAWLQTADFKRLLAEDGDVTVFTPITQPAPTPTPPAPSAVTAQQVADAVRAALAGLGL